MKKNWSEDSRRRQRDTIVNTKPWNSSTWSKSSNGKARSSQNANKGKAPIREMKRMVSGIHRERLELVRLIDGLLIEVGKRGMVKR